MARETTLDAFLAGEADGSGIQTTLSVTPDGAPCGVCGRTVVRRWRDEDSFVCADCKEWHRS